MNHKISKLGIKFIFSTLIPVLAVLLIAGVVCYSVVSQNKTGSIVQDVFEQAAITNDKINDTLTDIEDSVNLENGSVEIYNYIINSNPVRNTYFYSEAVNRLDEFVESDSSAVHSAWAASFSDGVIISDRKNGYDKSEVTDFSSYPWYDKEQLNKKEAYISGIYSSHIGLNNRVIKVMSIVMPVLDISGNAIGAYGVEIPMLYLNSLIELNNSYHESLAIVIDDSGIPLFYEGARTESDYAAMTNAFGNCDLSSETIIDFKGENYFAIPASLPGQSWNVIYMIKKSDIVSKVNSMALPMVITLLAAAICLSVVMLAFITKFIGRVRLIISNTIDISKDCYSNRMLVDSNDEFGELAIVFNDTIDRLKYIAEHDDITNIFNISTFYSEAEKLIKQNDEKTGKYAIVRLDIDHFRIINDIYNWQVGNNVLLHIADSIKRNITEDSICGRLFGDVFVICIKYQTAPGLEQILLRIKESILSYDIIVKVNPHFGVYLDAEKDIPVYLLCDRAGIALEIIKGNLLSTISYYDNSVNRRNMDIKFIETHMQAALDEKQFFIQLQPKYNMETNEIVGAEALVRWNHPEKGILKPDMFIPIFEKNGFVIKMDEFVWEETCKQIRKWLDMGRRTIPISVNVSRVHIYDKNFIDKLCALVKKYDIPVELLELEFTESALLDDVKELYLLMNKLKEKHFALLMDDFASGYSSLNTLKSAPFDIVKIDREFISAICESDRDRMLVASTVSMINNQNMKIVVEGVERSAQVEILKEAGCSIAQGYFYSKPLDIATFEKVAFK